MTAKKCTPMSLKNVHLYWKAEYKKKKKKKAKNAIWRQNQYKNVQQKCSSPKHLINLIFLRTEMLILHVCWKNKLKAKTNIIYGAKNSAYFFLASSLDKYIFSYCIWFCSRSCNICGSDVLNLFMLMARACIDVMDFIITSESKSNGLVICTKQ